MTRKKTPRQIIQAFMKKYGMETGGCRTFYTPKEWRARGEQFGLKSKLIVVYDGSELAMATNPDYEKYDLYNELDAALRAEGYYLEQCTGWYSAVYEV